MTEQLFMLFMLATAISTSVASFALLSFTPIKTFKPHRQISMWYFFAYFPATAVPFVVASLSQFIKLDVNLSFYLSHTFLILAFWFILCGVSWRRYESVHLWRRKFFWCHLFIWLTGGFYLHSEKIFSLEVLIGMGFGWVLVVHLATMISLHRIKSLNPGEKILSGSIVLTVILSVSDYIVLLSTHDLKLHIANLVILSHITNVLLLGAVYSMFLFDKVKKHKSEAERDFLTNIYNRRAFFKVMSERMEDAKLASNMGVMVMCDIDRFKSVNDTHGHEVGDVVIKHMADVIASNLRSGDVYARMGGEEFAFYLKDADIDTAIPVVERIRSGIEKSTVHYGQLELHYTASFGVSELTRISTIDLVLQQADKALYQSKSQGRNCISQFEK